MDAPLPRPSEGEPCEEEAQSPPPVLRGDPDGVEPALPFPQILEAQDAQESLSPEDPQDPGLGHPLFQVREKVVRGDRPGEEVPSSQEIPGHGDLSEDEVPLGLPLRGGLRGGLWGGHGRWNHRSRRSRGMETMMGRPWGQVKFSGVR